MLPLVRLAEKTHNPNHATETYKRLNTTVAHTVSRYPAGTYGERIRQKRLEMGLTQRDLAKLLRTDKMSVFNWENEKHGPSPASQGKIREVLCVER